MLSLTERINALLPQTQCTRCGYPDCAAYAQAIATEDAAINRCPPGGDEGVRRLAALTGQPVTALDAEHGHEGPRHVAVIDEAWCIGCTLCLPVCPTDAILGSNKLMHSVIEKHCTGCELCIPVCPVDCISLVNVTALETGWNAWSPTQAEDARSRYAFHQIKLVRDTRVQADRLVKKAQEALADVAAHSKHTDRAVLDAKRAVIEAALARARARRHAADSD
ncbi:MAG: electron transport complex subunit RsxB [Polaromonas sp.]|nr:electron transport complex subunit RsxB [Polaromonas sp.]